MRLQNLGMRIALTQGAAARMYQPLRLLMWSFGQRWLQLASLVCKSEPYRFASGFDAEHIA